MGRKILLFILMIVLSILLCGTVSAADQDYTSVKVGEDQVFTNMTYHEATNGIQAKGNSILYSYASNDHHYDIDAEAKTGVKIKWDTDGKTWDEVKNIPVKVTVDFEYQLSATGDQYASWLMWLDSSITEPFYFETLDTPDEYPYKAYKSKHSIVSDTYKNVYDYHAEYTTIYKKELLTVGNVNPIFISAMIHGYSAGDPEKDTGMNKATVNLKINSIKIEFLSKPASVEILGSSSTFIDSGSSDVGRGVGKFYYKVSPSDFKGFIIPVVRSESGNIIKELPSFTAKSSGYFTWDGKIDGKIVNPLDNPYHITLLLKEKALKLNATSKSYQITVKPSLNLTLSYSPNTILLSNDTWNKKPWPRIYYTLSVTNTGRDTIKNVKVTDTTSKFLKYIYYSYNLKDWSPWTGNKNINSIKPGKTITLYLVGTVYPYPYEPFRTLTEIKNTATITCPSIGYHTPKYAKVSTPIKWIGKINISLGNKTVPDINTKPPKGDKPDDWEPPNREAYIKKWYDLNWKIIIQYPPIPKPV